jgi:hypothetical protein
LIRIHASLCNPVMVAGGSAADHGRFGRKPRRSGKMAKFSHFLRSGCGFQNLTRLQTAG